MGVVFSKLIFGYFKSPEIAQNSSKINLFKVLVSNKNLKKSIFRKLLLQMLQMRQKVYYMVLVSMTIVKILQAVSLDNVFKVSSHNISGILIFSAWTKKFLFRYIYICFYCRKMSSFLSEKWALTLHIRHFFLNSKFFETLPPNISQYNFWLEIIQSWVLLGTAQCLFLTLKKLHTTRI